jgi:hypothetical protein
MGSQGFDHGLVQLEVAGHHVAGLEVAAAAGCA